MNIIKCRSLFIFFTHNFLLHTFINLFSIFFHFISLDVQSNKEFRFHFYNWCYRFFFLLRMIELWGVKGLWNFLNYWTMAGSWIENWQLSDLEISLRLSFEYSKVSATILGTPFPFLATWLHIWSTSIGQISQHHSLLVYPFNTFHTDHKTHPI